MMGFKVRIGIFGNKYKLIGLLLLFGLFNYADAKCYKCNSANATCGFLQTADTVDCTNDSLGCYVALLDVASDIPGLYAERGCTEDLTNGVCSDSLCEICSTDGCNGYVYPTDRDSCIKCQGTNCGTTAEISTMCEVYAEGSNNCITLFDEEGVVQHKNCYSDIPDDTKDICDDETQLDCTKCEGTNCNTGSQQRGLKCFKCEGLACFSPEYPADTVDCLYGGCYVGINANGENVRDCSSAISNSTNCGTTANPRNNCIVCGETVCNGFEYPSNRLVCQVCIGDACLVIGSTKTCEIALSNETCVTVFDSTANSVIERGCSSSLTNQQVCTANSERCRQCSTAGCNTDNDITKLYHCIACNSITDSSCLESPTIPTSCSTNSCYSSLVLETNSTSRYTLQRGCSADRTETCVEPNCQQCVGENCNNAKFPTNRLTCLKCANDECLMSNISASVCSIHDSSHLSCITVYSEDNEAIYRDCYADSAVGTQEYCDDNTQLSCTKCTGDSCNKDTVRRGNLCFKCSGIGCFQPELPSDTIECLSSCYVGINATGEIVRDCASNIANSTQCSSVNSGQTDCLLCNGDYCNGELFPTSNRLQCKTCLGAANCDLNLAASTYCPIYGATEKCVSVYNASSDQVIERGCLSSLSSESNATCSVAGPNCPQCTMQNCNIETSKTKTYHCYTCDSQTDSTCIQNPTNLTTCATSSCYSRLLTGTALGQPIERGCLSDITTCSSANCTQCSGEYCNTGVYPTDRLKCLSCANDQCKSSTIPEKLCQLYTNVNQSCITFYSEDSTVIYRDCYADAQNATRVICDDSTELECTKCIGASCNKDVTRRGNKCIQCAGLSCFNPDIPADMVNCLGSCYVGVNGTGHNVRNCSSAISNSSLCGTTDNGVSRCLNCQGDLCNSIAFPVTGRLRCQTCLGSENCKPNDANIQYCPRYGVNETCVSIFDSVINQVNERGCLSSVINKAFCDSNSTNCKKCTGNNCNLDTSNVLTNRCISCNSDLDSLCISNPTSWTECTTNECYSRILNPSNRTIGHQIERGCGATLAAACAEPDCRKCNGTNCNNLTFPTDRLTCLKCTNAGCQTGQTTNKQCVLYNGIYQSCITFFNDLGQVNYRDCYADAPALTQSICDDEKQLDCTKCTTSICNSVSTRRGNKCLQCNGLTCFTPNIPADVIDCLSGCYIGLNVRGETVRDCAASVLNSASCGTLDNGNNTCSVCVGDECNAVSFPLANRLTCHSCLGDECLAPISTQVCPRINADERCATVFALSADIPIERGCSSSLSNQLICDNNDARCVKCTTTNCNMDMSRVKKICANCNSTSDPNCVRNPLLVNQKTCTKGCYTKLTGQVLSRGCEEELTATCNSTSSCVLCSSNDLCNVQLYPTNRLSCHTCVGSPCPATTPQLCINSTVNDQCVTIFSGYSVARRGCLSDQSTADASICAGTSGDCVHCTTANCNIATVRSNERCVTCDSRSDARCSQKPLEIPTQSCSATGNGVCFARTIASGATIRGCAATLNSTQLKNCQDGIDCTICTGDSCNTAIQPSNHLKCYTCTTASNSSCEKKQANDNLLLCRNQIPGDQCVEIRANKKLTNRGCLSDLSLVCADTQGCTKCSGDGCNKNNSTIIKLHIACLIISLLCVFKNFWRN